MIIQDIPALSFLLLVAEAAVIAVVSFLVLGYLFLGGREFFRQMFDSEFRVGDTQPLNKGSACPKGE